MFVIEINNIFLEGGIMKKLIILIIMIFLTFFVSIISATIINVPDDQPTIQAGINVSVDGDTVLVQPGNYVENINYNGKNITVASLFLTTQDTTYISQTIIDGGQEGSVVAFENGESETAVLIGFTITNGYSDEAGGGINCDNSSPSLQNLIIAGNLTEWGGGGIYCLYSNPYIENVSITDNSATSGGGIYCEESSPSLENVTITDNSAGGGGGILCSFGNPSLVNVIITGNSADWFGGGIYCDLGNPSLLNVIITDNNAYYYGGGIVFLESNPSLINVTITGNSATLFYSGGIFCTDNSNPSLINCILWNDSPQEIYFSEEEDPNSITISYSDIQGGEAGIVTNNNGTVNWLEGNINEDPLFGGTGEDPYSLLEYSPCIDAGIPDTTGLNLPPWDIIGNLRIWDGDGNGTAIIDMGAYEYGAPPYVDVNDCQLSIVDFQLYNYPNPFNPSGAGRSPETTINYQLPEDSEVELIIYNIKGQKVKQLVSDQLSAGQHSVTWNGRDSNNKRVSSGIYFYKLKAGDYQKIRKMILLR